MTKKILVVEDDEDIREIVLYNLKKESYETNYCLDGEKALKLVSTFRPNLIILDLMLPGIDGLEVCKKIKNNPQTEDIPIIMLSAKSQESDKIIGLELGADDYITKPFSPKELMARIKSVLRRYKPETKKSWISIGKVEMNGERHEVKIASKNIDLTPTEFKLLELLITNCGMVVSREKILNKIFGYEKYSYDRTVDTHVKSLRKKMGKTRDHIKTVRGIGYKFIEL